LEFLIKCIRKVKYETEYEDEKCFVDCNPNISFAFVRFFRIIVFVAK
jgi:hypothetical protein